MFTPEEIKRVIKNAKFSGKNAKKFRGISIDSRTVKAGDLFIPIKGQRYDGRKFIKEAIKKGATVLDTKQGVLALQKIAAYHRNKFEIPFIGVTGSAGKTTTKDMIASILSQKMITLKNEGNYNNEIGVPLTLLRLNKNHQAAVIEMAMQNLGEIALLAKIVKPTISVVTNIGEAHLKFLKNKTNIAKAKAEIFKCQKRNDFAVINADDEFFENLVAKVNCKKSNIVSFGLIEEAIITPKQLKGIKLPVPGEHNIYNAMAAIAVAQILKIPTTAIKKGLEIFRPSSNRMDVINLADGTKIINDTYNANPQSMTALLKVLASLKGRKIAVLGDMFELGKKSKTAHKKIGILSRQLGIDKLITIGKLSKDMNGDSHYILKAPAIKYLKKIIRPGDRLLVKASRGMRLEEVVEAIRKI